VVADEADFHVARERLPGAGDVLRREIEAVEARVGQRLAEEPQEMSGAAGDIEELHRPRRPVPFRPGETDYGRHQPPAHDVGGSAEDQLHLQVVELRAGVPEVSIGLVMEIAGVVPRVALRLAGQLVVAPAADALAGLGKIGDELGSGEGVLAPGQTVDQLPGIQPIVRVLPVAREEVLDATAQRCARLRGRLAQLPAGNRPGIGNVGHAEGGRAGGARAHVIAAGELGAEVRTFHDPDGCARALFAQCRCGGESFRETRAECRGYGRGRTSSRSRSTGVRAFSCSPGPGSAPRAAWPPSGTPGASGTSTGWRTWRRRRASLATRASSGGSIRSAASRWERCGPIPPTSRWPSWSGSSAAIRSSSPSTPIRRTS